jgi:hypothetical protein
MMTRRLLAAVTGLLLGVVLAVFSIEVFHVDRFALSQARVLLGYSEVAALGFGVALASKVAFLPPIRRGILGGSIGLTLTFAARIWPTPWVNLYAFGAGGGPAGELPLIVIPACGLVITLAFFWDA